MYHGDVRGFVTTAATGDKSPAASEVFQILIGEYCRNFMPVN